MKVLGIELYDNGKESAIDLIVNSTIEKCKNLCISATGAHGIIESKKNNHFKEILNNFYLNLPDGMPSVWVGKMKGAKRMSRCYGPDFFKEVISQTASSPKFKHFFCGGNEGVAQQLKAAVDKKFNNRNIVGTYCPPYLKTEDYNYEHIAKIIHTSNANIVWIGLSTPKQEMFASYLSRYTNVSYLICVGAAFDFHIDAVPQAPNMIQKLGMEWLFRLIMEPKRLWKRYLVIVPSFIYYNFAELLTGKFFPKKSE